MNQLSHVNPKSFGSVCCIGMDSVDHPACRAGKTEEKKEGIKTGPSCFTGMDDADRSTCKDNTTAVGNSEANSACTSLPQSTRKRKTANRSVRFIIYLCNDMITKERDMELHPDVKRAILQLRKTAESFTTETAGRARKQMRTQRSPSRSQLRTLFLAEVEAQGWAIVEMVMCDVARLFEIMVLARLQTGSLQYSGQKKDIGKPLDLKEDYIGNRKRHQPWEAALKLYAYCREWFKNKDGEKKQAQLAEIMSLLTMAR